MHRVTVMLTLTLLLMATVAGAEVELQKLRLSEPGAADKASFTVLEERGDAITVEFTLPALDLEELRVEGETFQALSIPGGNLAGKEGQAGLPCITRLIAIPDGAAVSLKSLDRSDKVLTDYNVFPVQPDDTERFVIDRNFYAGQDRAETPAIEIGEPAILRDMRVVSVTFHPTRYDAARRELTVATRMTVELDLSGVDERNASVVQRSLIPESFDHLYRDTILNYRSGDAQVGPGTYLVFHRDNSTVAASLEPLLDWRRRQGYNVIVETTLSGTTNSQIKSTIQSYYDSVEPPLEFVVLVGDATGSYSVPCWFENNSGYHGEGDHYYTTLEGGDVLPDVHIGRLSIQNTTELNNIVDKIVNYETVPPTADSGWFTRAGLAGDTSPSGITCIYVNQWLKAELLEIGYTQVDTLWHNPTSSTMSTTINQGLTVFGYRGWLGMSGLESAHIGYLSNGYKLPFAIVVTCGTGSFYSESNTRSEAFLRAPNGGAVGAVGTATTGTHTRYNNSYYHGVWEGAVNGSDHRLGVAHSRGKLELFNCYYLSQPSVVDTWCMWNNLMGDPATDMWTGYPATLTVTHDATIAVGANSVPVSVHVGPTALDGALVCVYKEGEVVTSDYTDFQGEVNLPIADYSAGTLLVTVTKHNHMPYLGQLTLGSVSTYISFADLTIDDDNSGGSQGNGNGELNPGETIELPVQLRNYGSSSATGVTATIQTNDIYVTIVDGSENYGNIGAGASDWSDEDFDIALADHTPDGHVVALDLNASSGISDWTSLIELMVYSAAFDFQSFGWAGGATLDPGESGYFTITLLNSGSRTATSAVGTLVCESPWVTVTDASGVYDTVNVGASSSGGFALAISDNCFEGHMAAFTLTVTHSGGQQAVVEFMLPVGSASSNDPVGPDGYGYYAFDNTDTGYPFVPTYTWIEIDPNYGGNGVDVGLSDFGWEQDDTEFKTLPFTFQYYGQTYDQISICSNGWIAMGTTYLEHYRNWSIPSAGSPNAMIAGYWDNLYQTGTNRVYHWFDSDNGRYIIEWSRVRNDYSDATETFEIILYDPNVYQTPTGDGLIVIQFNQVAQTDSRDGYGTVGIQNLDGTDGVLYTYWNQYAPGAASLSSGRAIAFQPVGDLTVGTLQGEITNASNGGTPAPGVTVRILESGQSIISGSDGLYSGGVNEGVYTVRAEHPSFESVTVPDVTIVEDEVTTLDFALTDILGPLIENVSMLPYTDDTVGPYVVDFWVTDYSDIDDVALYYKINGGGQFEPPLTLVDAETGQYRAEIPGYGFNTRIGYWVEALDSNDNASREPASADEYYEFWILNSVLVIDDDMQSDQGWTVNDGSDDATTGIWVRVDPIGVFEGGTEVQPEDDASADGTLCWITGNGETGAQGVDDVDVGKTTLFSPVFDLSETVFAQLSYRRWYTNDTGFSTNDIWLVEITDDGSEWVTLESSSSSDRSWSLHSFLVEDFVDLTAQVQLRFVASDYPDGGIVEAGVDEFLLSAFEEPTATSAGDGEVPAKLTLMQNSPNPFNPETRINFGLPSAQKVDLRVYDASGRLVKTLLDGHHLDAGFQGVTWNGRDEQNSPVASGIYFYRLSTERETLSSKMTLLK